MTQKPKDWNGECPARACTRFAHATNSRELSATDDFFVVSDMGSYYNVYRQHHYSANTSDAVLTDLKAGLDILYLRSGPNCRDDGNSQLSIDCPDTASTSQQSNETHDALEFATNGSRPDDRFTLADLDAKAATALRIRFDLGIFDPAEGNPYAQPIAASVRTTRNTKGYSSTHLAMGFANVRAGTQKRREIGTRVPFCIAAFSQVIDGPAHRKVARDATAASVVLLKNDGSCQEYRIFFFIELRQAPYFVPGLPHAVAFSRRQPLATLAIHKGCCDWAVDKSVAAAFDERRGRERICACLRWLLWRDGEFPRWAQQRAVRPSHVRAGL